MQNPKVVPCPHCGSPVAATLVKNEKEFQAALARPMSKEESKQVFTRLSIKERLECPSRNKKKEVA